MKLIGGSTIKGFSSLSNATNLSNRDQPCHNAKRSILTRLSNAYIDAKRDIIALNKGSGIPTFDDNESAIRDFEALIKSDRMASSNSRKHPVCTWIEDIKESQRSLFPEPPDASLVGAPTAVNAAPAKAGTRRC